ncbi:MazG nucleotide pyrophosphohydrolase domain-containing protein [Desulfolithobacter sp.]
MPDNSRKSIKQLSLSDAGDVQGFLRLKDIIARLRSADGCPWDRRQTPQSLKKYLLEEAAELADAIEEDDPAHVCEEIGDLFYILGMLNAMYADRGDFTASEALSSICKKMIRRHPHVFGDSPTGDDAALRRQWEAIKKKENKSL